MKKIGTVVVSYNSSADLELCVTSFLSQKIPGTQLEVCIVDNASKDTSVITAKKLTKLVITNKVNQGFSVAVNQGLHSLIDKGCDYFLILNPDAVIKPGSLASMMTTFDSNANIGAVGPRMVNADRSDANVGYYLKAPSFLTVLCFSTYLRPWSLKNKWLVKRYEEKLDNISTEVDQIPGAAIFTSRDKLDSIGLLSEEFAIWFEDVEWCYRARKMGYKMIFEPKAEFIHEGGVSFSKWNDLNKAVTFYVSMKTFFRIHKPISYPFVVLIIVLNSFALFIKNNDRSNLEFIKRFIHLKKGVLPKN